MKNWTLEFDDDGLSYKAGYGYLIVSENGQEIFRVLNCFKDENIPSKEIIIDFYKAFSKINNEEWEEL